MRMKCALMLTGFIFLVLGTATAERILEIDMDVYLNDDVALNSVRILDGRPSFYVEEGNYRLEILDREGVVVFEQPYELSFVIFTDPPVSEDVSTLYLKVPYLEGMTGMVLYNGEREIFSHDINLCDNDGICNAEYENHESCPGDCPQDEEDDVCDKTKDGICDPDCVKGADPDCVSAEEEKADYTPGVVAAILVLLIIAAFFVMKKR